MIIIVAEGDDAGGAIEVAKKVKEKFNEYDTRVSIIGHMQRGGSPTCFDRVLGSRMGEAAIRFLLNSKHSVMTGLHHRDIVAVPFEKAIKHNKQFNKHLLELAEVLAS